MVKNYLPVQEIWVRVLGQEDPLEKEMATHPGFSSGKSREQRRLAGYGPWSCKELDMTEHTHKHASTTLLITEILNYILTPARTTP